MAEKQRTLEVASFLDSAQARALNLDDAKVRKIVSLFVDGAYKELGKEPRLLDGHDAHVLVGHVLPGRLKKKDPLAEHVPDVLRAYLDFLEETEMVPEAFELRRGFEGTIDEFKEAVRTGHAAHHGPKEKVAPVIHQAPKLGRNDPCSCGSGKKFKKCHGKP